MRVFCLFLILAHSLDLYLSREEVFLIYQPSSVAIMSIFQQIQIWISGLRHCSWSYDTEGGSTFLSPNSLLVCQHNLKAFCNQHLSHLVLLVQVEVISLPVSDWISLVFRVFVLLEHVPSKALIFRVSLKSAIFACFWWFFGHRRVCLCGTILGFLMCLSLQYAT